MPGRLAGEALGQLGALARGAAEPVAEMVEAVRRIADVLEALA